MVLFVAPMDEGSHKVGRIVRYGGGAPPFFLCPVCRNRISGVPTGGWLGVGCLEDGGGGCPPFQFIWLRLWKIRDSGVPFHLDNSSAVDWFASTITDVLELDDVLLLLC